jgi:uncharacterized pyridoxamine 5'-phosphate oxidase family protein
MATVDEHGNPQIRIIDIMHVESDALYFLTARGKPFYKELLQSKKVAIVILTPKWESIRVNGIPELIKKDEQKKWLDLIFDENESMKGVYPGNSRYVLEVFCIKNAEIEYFNLGSEPIFRETYILGNYKRDTAIYVIGNKCTQCGVCQSVCPQKCIQEGEPYKIQQEHCLRCGLCKENCPNEAIIYNAK